MRLLKKPATLILLSMLTIQGLSAKNILIKLTEADKISEITQLSDATEVRDMGNNIYLLKFSEDKDISKICKKLVSYPMVEYAHPDRIKTIRKR